MNKEKKHCLLCKKTEEEVPLFELTFKGKTLNICPQHVPVLIHEPQKLVGIVEGADNMQAG